MIQYRDSKPELIVDKSIQNRNVKVWLGYSSSVIGLSEDGTNLVQVIDNTNEHAPFPRPLLEMRDTVWDDFINAMSKHMDSIGKRPDSDSIAVGTLKEKEHRLDDFKQNYEWMKQVINKLIEK